MHFLLFILHFVSFMCVFLCFYVLFAVCVNGPLWTDFQINGMECIALFIMVLPNCNQFSELFH